MKNNTRIDSKINKRLHYFDLFRTSLVGGIVAIVIMYFVIGIYITLLYN